MEDPDSAPAPSEPSEGKATLDDLMPVLYAELRRLAQRHLRGERTDHTLGRTALVHEAYLRLVNQHSMPFENRPQFFAITARMMRRILVDHARAGLALRRGAGAAKISLDDLSGTHVLTDRQMVALDDALQDLEKLDQQQSQVVELRYFAGLTVEETAEALGISEATVKRDWASAKAWLYRELTRSGSDDP
jgi:RNA polymerase sigma factor (TIGR02999 family)